MSILAVQQQGQAILHEMGQYGVRIDLPRLGEVETAVDEELNRTLLGSPLADLENWRSDPQIHDFFRSKYGKLPRNRKTKSETVDRRTLHVWASKGDEDASKLLTLRELDMAKKLYLGPYRKYADDQGIVRPQMLVSRQGTGRVSCIQPNFFQVPKRSERLKKLIRSLIIPRDGMVLLEADWKQIELELVFYFAGIEKPRDRDFHQDNANDAGVDRTTAKIVTHGTNYKGSPSEIAYQAESYGYTVPISAIARVQRMYLEKYPQIPQWWERVERTVADNKGILKLPFGRIRRFQGQAKDWAKEAIATLPQGTVYDMMVRCLPDLWDPAITSRMLLPVHDSILWECHPAGVESVARACTIAMGRRWGTLGRLSVPADIQVSSTNWAEMEEYNG